MNFCRRCGTALTKKAEAAYVCLNNHSLYSNPAPTVGMFLLDHSGNIVLSVRGIEPDKGMLDSIGGFVDDGETFEQALKREIREETGLEPHDYSVPKYLTSAPSGYEYDGETRSVLSCFYYATLTPTANPVASDDVASLVTVAPHDIDIDDFGGADVRVGIATLLKVIA